MSTSEANLAENFVGRLAEEIVRLGDASKLKDRMGRNRNTIYDWKKKGNIPGYELERLGELGADLIYIVSGTRSLPADYSENPDALGGPVAADVIAEIFQMFEDEGESSGRPWSGYSYAYEAAEVYGMLLVADVDRHSYQDLARALVKQNFRIRDRALHSPVDE